MGGIINESIHDVPVSIIDFETTGLTPGNDRVIEVSVVRLEPGKDPVLAFDTLVNPKRKVSATEIHGITDEDVVDAPIFSEIAGDLVEAVSGTVIAAYNVYFDIKFWEFELSNVGIPPSVPHFCLMYMRPMLGLGKRCNLITACNELSIEYNDAHIASEDAIVSAKLLQHYLTVMKDNDINTYKDLKLLKSYKFINSFSCQPLSNASTYNLQTNIKVKSRANSSQSSKNTNKASKPRNNAVKEYWEALCAALYDLQISDEELNKLQRIKQKANMPKEEVRMLHARFFASVINNFVNDKWLDDGETKILKRVHNCLSKLGWAPGE